MRKCIIRMTVLLWITVIPCLVFSQSKTLSGKITDGSGAPLPGVSIAVKNSSLGTVTDGEGKFRLNVSPGAVLLISSAGFKSQTLDADKFTAEMQIKLEEDVARLDEVVVTGLATSVKRKNLANAVATISAKQLNAVAPAQTFDAALEGKISGAYINANSGAPGGGISIKLRGVTSVYGNSQPLYVVDGIFVDNSVTSAGLNVVTSALNNGAITSTANGGTQDNPSSRIADLRAEDIENIEILKGASAAAIYGSRAAAGVVIITTKKGKEGRTKITVSQDLGAITVRKLLGVRTYTDANLAKDPAASPAFIQAFKDAEAAHAKIYDYEKEVYDNTGFARNTLLNISGSNGKTGFYFSVAQKDEGGIVKNTGYRNSSVRLNLDHKLTDNIKIGLSTNYVNSSADRGLFGNDNKGITTGIALAFTPSFAELHADADGNYPNNPFFSANPLQTIALMRNNESVNRFITGINLEAVVQKSTKSTTKIVGRGGLDFYNLETNAVFPGVLQFQAESKGTTIQGYTNNLNTNYILSLVNTFTPSDRFSLTESVGFTQETGNYNNLINSATQVIAGQTNVDQAGALNAVQLKTRYQNQGLFLQEEANLNDLLTLTGGVRFDRSSNNGDPAKYYVYPKAGVSFNLTRLDMLKGNFFDNLKVRAAYGQANNVPAYGSKFTSLSISNITGYPGLIVATQEGRADIKPERQTEFETGIDFSIFNGKLGIEATYYQKKIFDFLMLQNLPAASGYSQKWVNAGNLQNEGVEIGLTARPVQTRDIKWNTSLNFWLNRSKVTKLTIPSIPQGAFGYVLGSFQIQEGKSATQILGLNGQGVGKLGDAEPDFQMNTYNEITFWNKLSLRFLLHWKKGGQNVNLTSLESDFGGTTKDYDKVTNKAGLPDGFYHITQVGTNAQEFVQTSSYLRLREIGLYYSFTKLPVDYVKGLRVGVSLNNFLTVTKYKAYDPEVSNFGTGFSSGVDVDPYPATKRIDFHLSLDF